MKIQFGDITPFQQFLMLHSLPAQSSNARVRFCKKLQASKEKYNDEFEEMQSEEEKTAFLTKTIEIDDMEMDTLLLIREIALNTPFKFANNAAEFYGRITDELNTYVAMEA